ncbi:MAG: hypothetical protein ACJ79R_20625 [Anaeromyxobacteraceae bacterium]
MHGTRYQVAVVLLAAALTACGGSQQSQGSGSVRVAGSMRALTPNVVATSKSVTKVTLTLKAHAHDLADVVRDAVVDANGKFSFAFVGVPAGPGREIVAEAFDVNGNMLFEGGKTDITISGSGTPDVILTLEQTDASKIVMDEWPPFIKSVTAANGLTVKSGEVVPLTVIATEGPSSDASTLTYSWTNAEHNGTFSAPASARTDFQTPTTTSAPVLSNLTITVTDAQGNKAALSFTITVLPVGEASVTEIAFSNAPVATKISISTPGNVDPDVGVPVSIVVDASDADGEQVWVAFLPDCEGTVTPSILATPGSMGILSGQLITFTPSASPEGGVCNFTFILCSGEYTKETYAYNVATAHIQLGAPVAH